MKSRRPTPLRLALLCPLLLPGAQPLAGCTSPPSVSPLLRATQEELARQAERIEATAPAEAARYQQRRIALADAFEADLRDRRELSPEWVREAVAGYLPAREAVLRQQLQDQHQRRNRTENLRLLAQAQARAAELLSQQDALWQRWGLDLWALVRGDRNPE